MKKPNKTRKRIGAFFLVLAVLGSAVGQNGSLVSAVENQGSSTVSGPQLEDEGSEPSAVCICETQCLEGAVREDCPVCGGEDGDLTACTGTVQTPEESGGEDEVLVELEPETIILDDGILPDNDELFAGYVQQQMYDGMGDGVSTFGNFGERALSGLNLEIYRILKAEIAKVASGERQSTVFEIPITDLSLQTEWTAQELNITSSEEIDQAVAALLASEGYDSAALFDCLITDCPYELYWFDKTQSHSSSPGGVSYTLDSQENLLSIRLTGPFSFRLVVADAYKGDTDYEANTTKTSATQTAVAKAQEIVSSNAGKSDYDKLVAYKNAICDLVSYNHAAADDDTTPYGDPWQLIYVFDGDTSTNVVCEGYAKAFQYLCDLTTWTGSVACYTVTGTMSGGTGSGGHMWNIVTIGGNNYLVDVTNCDDGTIGAPDNLFLAGGLTGSYNTEYVYTASSGTPVTYVYASDQRSMYGADILTLADADYTPSAAEPSVSISGTGSITYGDTLTLNAQLSNITGDVSYQWYRDDNPLAGYTSASCVIENLSVKTDGYTFKVEVTDSSGATYSATCAVTVSKAAPAYTAPSSLTATYGDMLSTVSLPDASDGTWSWEDGTVTVGNAGTNNFNAVFTPADSVNYSTATVSVPVSVGRATPAIAFTGDARTQTWTFTGGSPTITPPTVTLVNGEVYDPQTHGAIAYSYVAADAEAGTELTSGLPTQVGTYTLYAGIPESDNYTAATTGAENACSLTIREVQLTGTVTLEGTFIYGETVTASVSGQEPADAVLTYSFYVGDSSAAVQSGTQNTFYLGTAAVGQTVKVEVTAAGCEGTLTSASSAEVARRSITITPDSGQSKIYGVQDAALTHTISVGSLASGDSLTGQLQREEGENVGTYRIHQGTLTVNNADCYSITFTEGVDFTIQKADYKGTVSAETSAIYGGTAEYVLSGLYPDGAFLGDPIVQNGNSILDGDVTLIDEKLSYTLVNNADKVGETATVSIPVTHKNYNDFTITITIKVSDKNGQILSFAQGAVTKTYGDGAFTNELTGAQTGATYTSSDTSVATVDANGQVTILKAGRTTITATAAETADYAEGSASYELTVNKKFLTVTVGSYKVAKTYDGTTSMGTASGALSVAGILAGDENGVTVSATGAYDNPNAGGQSAMTVSLSLSGSKANNYQLSNSTVSVPCSITPKAIVPAIAVTGTYIYSGTAITPTFTVSYQDGTENVRLTAGTDYTAVFSDNINAGTAAISIMAVEGSNYTWEGEVKENFIIEKADYRGSKTAKTSAIYGKTAEYTLSGLWPDGASLGTLAVQDENAILDSSVTLNGTNLSYRLVNDAGKVGETAVVSIPVTHRNYNDFDITITIEVADKNGQTLGFAAGAVTKTYGDGAFTNTLTGAQTGVTYTSSAPSVADVDANGQVTVLAAGTATITAAAAENEDYKAGSASYNLTVDKKSLTVTAGSYRVTKTYDGTTSMGTASGSLTVSGVLEKDANEVTVRVTGGAYHDPNVGGQSAMTVSLSLSETGTDNYQLGNSTVSVPCSITPKTIVPAITVTGSYAYSGTAITPTFTVSCDNGGERTELTAGRDYTSSFSNNTNAGTGTISVTAAEGGNYTWAGAVTETFTIAKADYTGQLTGQITVKYGKQATYDLTALLPEGWTLGSLTVDDRDQILNGAPTVAEGVLTLALANQKEIAGKSAVITIPVTETRNYHPFRLTITVNAADKDAQTLAFASPSLEKTYGSGDFTNSLTGAAAGSTVTYRSSDPTVAAVDQSGKVRILKAGTAVITASASETADYAAGEAFYNLTVSPLALSWDTSALTAADKETEITDKQATLAGSLKVTGILAGDAGDAVFTCPASSLKGTYVTVNPGSQRVILSWAAEPAVLQGDKAGNYILPAALPEITGTINEVTPDLPTPPESAPGRQYRLELEHGISAVPEGLRGIERLNTPAKIETEMRLSIRRENAEITQENTAVYDVTLWINIDGGGWTVATKENFPAGGITVTLPYPEGTGRETHNFTVAHMATMDLNGMKAGEIEYPAVTKVEGGIQFKVSTLSPVSVGWTEIRESGGQDGGSDNQGGGQDNGSGGQGSDSGSQDGGNTRDNGAQPAAETPAGQTGEPAAAVSADTGDTSPIMIYVILLAAAAAIIIFLVYRSKKHRRE